MKRIPSNLIFCIATSLYWFSIYAYVPELSTYAKDLGASYKYIGIITGSYGLMQLIIRIPLGILSDRLNKRKIFIHIGILCTTLGSLITFFNPTTFSLLITRILAGIAASTWVAFTILYSSYYRANESTKAIGVLNAYNAAGQVVAMTIGGYLSSHFGTIYLYLLSSIGGALSLFISFFIVENKNISKVPITLNQILFVLKDKKLLFTSLLAILSQFLTFATLFGFTPLVAKNLGAKSVHLSTLTIIGILPAVIFSAASGTIISKRFGEKKTMLLGFILMSSLTVITPFIPSLSLLYVAQLFAGVGRSLVFPLLMGLCIKHIDPAQRATAMGVFQSLYGIGMLFGPILIGFIGDTFGLTLGFMSTGLIGLISIVLLKRTTLIESV